MTTTQHNPLEYVTVIRSEMTENVQVAIHQDPTTVIATQSTNHTATVPRGQKLCVGWSIFIALIAVSPIILAFLPEITRNPSWHGICRYGYPTVNGTTRCTCYKSIYSLDGGQTCTYKAKFQVTATALQAIPWTGLFGGGYWYTGRFTEAALLLVLTVFAILGVVGMTCGRVAVQASVSERPREQQYYYDSNGMMRRHGSMSTADECLSITLVIAIAAAAAIWYLTAIGMFGTGYSETYTMDSNGKLLY